mgnify:CR=1 FL=1
MHSPGCLSALTVAVSYDTSSRDGFTPPECQFDNSLHEIEDRRGILRSKCPSKMIVGHRVGILRLRGRTDPHSEPKLDFLALVEPNIHQNWSLRKRSKAE